MEIISFRSKNESNMRIINKLKIFYVHFYYIQKYYTVNVSNINFLLVNSKKAGLCFITRVNKGRYINVFLFKKIFYNYTSSGIWFILKLNHLFPPGSLSPFQLSLFNKHLYYAHCVLRTSYTLIHLILMTVL